MTPGLAGEIETLESSSSDHWPLGRLLDERFRVGIARPYGGKLDFWGPKMERHDDVETHAEIAIIVSIVRAPIPAVANRGRTCGVSEMIQSQCRNKILGDVPLQIANGDVSNYHADHIPVVWVVQLGKEKRREKGAIVGRFNPVPHLSAAADKVLYLRLAMRCADHVHSEISVADDNRPAGL
jgi:hypothetical protein